MFHKSKDPDRQPISDEIFSTKTLYNHEDRLNDLESTARNNRKRFSKIDDDMKAVVTHPQFQAGLLLKVLLKMLINRLIKQQ